MGLESGTALFDLDEDWPLANDPVGQGDDHLRIIKKILKSQFPGSGGGFSKPILANEDELNACVGITANIQDQLNNVYAYQAILEDQLNAPQDTFLLFHSQTVPLGWVIQHYGVDAMLRVIDPDVNPLDSFLNPGSEYSPIQHFGGHAHTTADFKLQESHMPRHRHTFGPFTHLSDTGSTHMEISNTSNFEGTADTSYVGGDQPHNHGNTGTGGVDWFPRYIASVIGRREGAMPQ